MIQKQPVITTGTIAGLILAGWQVILAQGMFDGVLNPEAIDQLTAFVNLAVPIIAAIIAARFVTPISNPNLPVGTVVNRDSDEPTSTVVRDTGDGNGPDDSS